MRPCVQDREPGIAGTIGAHTRAASVRFAGMDTPSSSSEQPSQGRRFGGTALWIAGVVATIIAGVAVPLILDRVQDDPARTTVSLARPFDANGHLTSGLHVKEHSTADCGPYPQSTSNPSAYRCGADDNYIYDPCFSYDMSFMVCPGMPWSKEVVLLRLHHFVKDHRKVGMHGKALTRPWGLRLANGDKCLFLQGASPGFVNGARVNYKCDHGNAIGVPDRSGPLWTIQYAKDAATQTSPVDVEQAWF
jgi:hypothetical protein